MHFLRLISTGMFLTVVIPMTMPSLDAIIAGDIVFNPWLAASDEESRAAWHRLQGGDLKRVATPIAQA
jgi:hypothetical protein